MQELLWTVFLYSQLCHNVSWECCYPELGTVMLIGNTLICTIGVSFLFLCFLCSLLSFRLRELSLRVEDDSKAHGSCNMWQLKMIALTYIYP